MVITEKATQVANHLNDILEQLAASAMKMECIVQEEREAAHVFAGEQLEQLFDDRARCQSALVELESRCRRLMMRQGLPLETSLEHFIDAHVIESEVGALQEKRVAIYRRLERVRVATEENRILLHAAWSVTNHVLHEIGALPVQGSYGLEVMAYGGAR